jgi:MFS family permease
MLLNEYKKLTKAHYLILFMSWAGWIFDFYDLILYSFLLIPIGNEFGFTKMELSIVWGVSLATTAIGGIIFGYLADRYGRKAMLQWTIIIYSVGVFMCGLTMNLWWLLIWRGITGLGVGGEWGIGQTLIGETFPPSKRGRFGAYMQTGAPLGVGTAAIMGSLFAPRFGWRATFIVSSLPAILAGVIRIWMPESDVWLKRKAMETKDIIKEKNRFLQLFSKELRSPFFISLILTMFTMSAYWFTYSWLPGYLVEERGLTIAKSGSKMLIVVIGEIIGYLSFGFFSDRYGRKLSFSIYSTLMASGLLMITIFWNIISEYPKLILFFMFLTGIGTGIFSNFGPLFTELFPTRVRNTAANSIFNLARGINFFTPVIIAAVAKIYGLAGGISLGALSALLAGLWVWLLPETKGKKIEI